METKLIERARSGDHVAFEELVEPYRRELQVHAYRMLGSVGPPSAPGCTGSPPPGR